MATTRIAFDRRLRLPVDGTLVRSARDVPVGVVCEPNAPALLRQPLQDAGVTIIAHPACPISSA